MGGGKEGEGVIHGREEEDEGPDEINTRLKIRLASSINALHFRYQNHSQL